MQDVVGSIPTGTTKGDVAQLVEHMPEEHGVVSSILTVTTIGLSSEYVSGLKLGKAKW